MPRKTIDVNAVLRLANAYLASEKTGADEREGVITMIEGVLFLADNYGGFRYLETTEVDGAGSRREYFLKRV